MLKKIFFLLFVNAFFITKAQITHSVNSITLFNTALNNANSGDIIEWENGIYTDVYMNIETSNITIKAQTAGNVNFNGASRVEIKGDNVTFAGMQFVGGDILVDGSTDTTSQTVITVRGKDVKVNNININEYTCWKYLRIREESQRTEISYCNFENRLNYADQNILQVEVSATQEGFHNIHHCSFKNFEGISDGGDDGVEPIRIGTSSDAFFSSKSIVEYCYFSNCNGDGEIISHKATNCIYRYNTFENNSKAELVLRHGDNALVYGNFFFNNRGGIRVQEGNGHFIFNNYFHYSTSRSLFLSNDDSDPVENILIAYNTFANTNKVDLSGGSDTQLPTNITLANNIFSNTINTSNVIVDATGTETWIGNIYTGNIGISIPATGLLNNNPDLTLNAEGFYTIPVTSPAVDSAQSGYPTLPVLTGLDYDTNIELDIMLNNRPTNEALKDIGCEEYNSLADLKAHVTEENTGTNYNIDVATLSISSDELITSSFYFYPNPVLDSFTIQTEHNITKIEVYNMLGQKLINKNYNLTNSVDISMLSEGTYIVKVIVNNKKQQFKIIKI